MEGTSHDKRYEPLDRASDGRLIRRSELEGYEAQLRKSKTAPKDYTIENPSRRGFIKKAAIVAGVVAIGGQLLKQEEQVDQDVRTPMPRTEEVPEQEADVREQTSSSFYTHEGELPVPYTPQEQLEKFGEIKDLASGLRHLYRKDYEYLSHDPSGKRDMHIARANMSKLNLERFFQPFRARNIPPEYAYLIAVQETRGLMTTSWAGAKGITGIMPDTAKMLGYSEHDLKDPYRCAEITSVYLDRYRDDFNNNYEMLMHAYNGGRGLLGFTDATSRDERTPERFYAYMQNFINARFKELKKNGYTEHEVTKGETLWKIALKHRMLPRTLQKFNGLSSSHLRIGQVLKIPIKDYKKAIETHFRKSFEVLEYTPQLFAKRDVLTERGLRV